MKSDVRSRPRRRAFAGGAVMVLMAAALVGCGDDETAQADYCSAGDELQSSLNDLDEFDLAEQGIDGLDDAVEQVRDDLAELRSSAADAVADDVDVVNDSIVDLEAAIADLGGDLTSENAAAVTAAIQGVRDASRAVVDTLADC